VHLIGGADVAAELDAKRAILQGTTLAASLEGAARFRFQPQPPGDMHVPAPEERPSRSRPLPGAVARMVAASDLGELHTIVHPDAVFRSPMANTPYASAPR
jgi:2,4-dienoyl-CoA reductase (NADPH2)